MWKPTTSSDALYHSAKGTHWGKHKYIAIKNGRYIYPKDKTDAYKKAQKAASEHAPHFEGEAGEGTYTYKYRTNSPGTSDNKLIVPYGNSNSSVESRDPYVKQRKSENPSHMRSDVERWDYFAGAAAKHDSTKKRMATAKSLARDAEETQLGQLAKKSPAYYSNPDQKKWETVAKSAGYRQKQKEELAAKKEKMKNDSQKSGKRRTLREQTKQARAGEKREDDAFMRAAREQEKGRNKTAYYTKQQKGNYADSSAAAARYKKQAEIASGGRSLKTTNTKYATSRESFETSKPAQAEAYEKKAKIAESVFKQGQTAQNNNRANTGRYGGMASYNSKRGKKPKNKTARKNQRRAKIESAAFKAKRISKKAVSKGKSLFSKYFKPKTKTYVTDTFTGTRKPANHSGKTINIKKH